MTRLDEVIELEEKRAGAWLAQDKDALADLLDEEYLETNIFGRFTKQQVLDDLFQKHILLEYQMTDPILLELGETAMAVSYAVKEKLISMGKTGEYHCMVVAIYRQRAGEWALLSWQITSLI